MPVLLMHGARDHVVSLHNTERLAAAFVLANARVSGRTSVQPEITTQQGEANGYRYTRSRSDASGAAVEWWIVAELGHAWSGGSPDGTFTNPNGPDASVEMLRFFREAPPIAAGK